MYKVKENGQKMRSKDKNAMLAIGSSLWLLYPGIDVIYAKMVENLWEIKVVLDAINATLIDAIVVIILIDESLIFIIMYIYILKKKKIFYKKSIGILMKNKIII